MEEKKLKINPVIVGALFVVIALIIVIIVAVIDVRRYHDDNTFADLLVSTKQGSYDSREVVKGSFLKGDIFTVDKYEFLVFDVEFEYMKIKLPNASFYDGSKMLKEGDVVTLHEGEVINLEVPGADTAFTISICVDNLWWF